MKKILFAALLFINLNTRAQDVLFISSGDSIKCKITLVNENTIFYEHKVKNEIENENIPLVKLAGYIKGGVRTNLTSASRAIIIDTNDKTAGDNLIEASKIIYTSLVIVVIGSIVAVTGSFMLLPAVAVIGEVTAFIGGIHSFSAWNKITQAGNILNKHKI